jgi:hypothetical protein
MQNRLRAWVLVTASVALTAAFAIFFELHSTQSIAARDAQPVAAPTNQAASAPALDTTRIVPADVLGTGVVSWAPLTGDGSN